MQNICLIVFSCGYVKILQPVAICTVIFVTMEKPSSVRSLKTNSSYTPAEASHLLRPVCVISHVFQLNGALCFVRPCVHPPLCSTPSDLQPPVSLPHSSCWTPSLLLHVCLIGTSVSLSLSLLLIVLVYWCKLRDLKPGMSEVIVDNNKRASFHNCTQQHTFKARPGVFFKPFS